MVKVSRLCVVGVVRVLEVSCLVVLVCVVRRLVIVDVLGSLLCLCSYCVSVSSVFFSVVLCGRKFVLLVVKVFSVLVCVVGSLVFRYVVLGVYKVIFGCK